jgi:hypothetical protein
MNWYVYCSNNPLVMVDPTGLADLNTADDAYKEWLKADIKNDGNLIKQLDGDWQSQFYFNVLQIGNQGGDLSIESLNAEANRLIAEKNDPKNQALQAIAGGIMVLVGGALLNNANKVVSVEETAAAGSRLTPQALKSIKSLEKQIAQHTQKLTEFKANPTVRPGMENLSPELILKQQQARILHLETEIKTFQENIQKITQGKM